VSLAELAWPLRLGPGGDFAAVDQGSLPEVVQAVQIVACTRVGERADLPAMGVDEPVPGETLDLTTWVAQVGIWEPRAAVTAAASTSGAQVTITLAVGA